MEIKCKFEGCKNTKGVVKDWCHGHYRQRSDGRPLTPLRPYLDSIEARMEAYTDRSGDCWLWQKGLSRGYGVITVKGGQRLAHRVAYEIRHGVQLIPEQVVHHICHQPLCVNPDHLQLVTHHENVSEALMVKALKDALREYAPDHPLLS